MQSVFAGIRRTAGDASGRMTVGHHTCVTSASVENSARLMSYRMTRGVEGFGFMVQSGGGVWQVTLGVLISLPRIVRLVDA